MHCIDTDTASAATTPAWWWSVGPLCCLLVLAACEGNFVPPRGPASPLAPTSPTQPTVPPDGAPPGEGPIRPGSAPNPNLVANAKYFDCNPQTPGATAQRVWRLTAAQYRQTLALTGFTHSSQQSPWSNPFDGSDTSERFSNYATSFSIEEPVLEALFTSSRVVVDRVMGRAQVPACAKGTTAPDDTCLRQTIRAVGQVFRRPLSDAEVNQSLGYIHAQTADLGWNGALKAGLELLVMSPDFLFRWEVGAGPADATGRLKLTADELATALAFTLTDAPPDALLLAAAAGGKLESDVEVRAQVSRLLTVKTTAPVMRFLAEYFRYPEAEGVFKDRTFALHKADQLVDDTTELLKFLVAADRDVLRQILTTRTAFILPTTANSYNLTATGTGRRQVELPATERAGILTHPSWLAALSQADENDPIRRGKFIRESLLCQALPPIPLDVVPQIPHQENATLRQRLAAHVSQPSCAGCHRLMDPLGLGFESFDHVGRRRTTEGIHPADGSGEILGSDVDGAFTDGVQLAERLGQSALVRQCFVRHAFRFFMGRSETVADACSLKAADDAYVQNGGSLAALLGALSTSDSYRYRQAAP